MCVSVCVGGWVGTGVQGRCVSAGYVCERLCGWVGIGVQGRCVSAGYVCVSVCVGGWVQVCRCAGV